MKKWFEFFCLSFFSHKISKGAARRGYTNVFLGFVLALVLLWTAFFSGDMLPFGVHYGNSPDFAATAHSVFANADADKSIYAKIENGDLKLGRQGSEYSESLFVNTLERDSDKENYSVGNYNIIVDSRTADTLAEVEAYCVSNDGKNTEISYEEYLTLSEVARLNFDFKLRYTGEALMLNDESVAGYIEYLDGAGDESRSKIEKLTNDLSENIIAKSEYNRAIYELYFTNYYPDITEYESSSAVPLLRNYYYHQYISKGIKNYLFIFDDYMIGSFETRGGVDVTFYGFYTDLDDGVIVADGAKDAEAKAAVDRFIKKSFNSSGILVAYTYFMNIVSLVPFIALMLMVATLLTYSVLKLRGVESVRTLGDMLKIVGSFVWFSGMISAVLTVIIMFFVNRGMINILPLLLFFVALIIRSLVFAIKENAAQPEQEVKQTEG